MEFRRRFKRGIKVRYENLEGLDYMPKGEYTISNSHEFNGVWYVGIAEDLGFAYGAANFEFPGEKRASYKNGTISLLSIRYSAQVFEEIPKAVPRQRNG